MSMTESARVTSRVLELPGEVKHGGGWRGGGGVAGGGGGVE